MIRTKSTRQSLFCILTLIITFSFGATPVMANLFGKSELPSAWQERFQDISKLKAYTDKGIKVTLDDVIIGKYDLTGAVFDGASFRGTEWNETMGKNMTFTNTIFRDNKFNSIEFTDATFTKVTFEDSEFNEAIFYTNQFVGVKFIRCKINYKSAFLGLQNSTVDFDYSTLTETSFAKSNANLTFRNSTLNDVRLIDLILPSTLTFENSKLQDVNLDRSKLATLVMDNATGGKSGFNGGSVAVVEVRNSAMGFNLDSGTLGKVTFVNSKIRGGFNRSNIKELQVNNCKGMEGLGLNFAKIDSLQISNCPINNIQTIEAVIQNFSINNASIENSKFKKMKVVNFTLTDVSLDGSLDFTGAHVEHLITKNVTKLPGLNLNLTGSNVKF